MTPDLTARIEELARETATGINQWHDTESMKTHCIELDTVVLRDVLSTFAASIIAEKDAAAAALQVKLDKLSSLGASESRMHELSSYTYYGGPGESVVQEVATAFMNEYRAGFILRSRLAEVEGQAAVMRASLWSGVFNQWRLCMSVAEATKRADETMAENYDTAGRDTLAELVQLRERVRELEGALNLPREQLAMLSRPMQSVTITPEGE